MFRGKSWELRQLLSRPIPANLLIISPWARGTFPCAPLRGGQRGAMIIASIPAILQSTHRTSFAYSVVRAITAMTMLTPRC